MELEIKEAPISGMNVSPAETCVLVDSSMTEEQPDGVTKDFGSPLLTSCFEINLGRRPVSASVSFCSPEEHDIHGSEVTISSPHSYSSDETCVNTPDRATSPTVLDQSERKLETTLRREDQALAKRQSLDDPNLKEYAHEFDQPLLPPCCNKIKREWEHTVKIIEANQETEVANMKDDLEAVQDLLQSLEVEKAHLSQDHKETLRKLREKSKEVRELKRELKTKWETLNAQEDLERGRADTIQDPEDDFSSQVTELGRAHKEALQELKDQHRNEVDKLERALHVKSEELSKKADLMQDWKDEAVRLQAQHDDVCKAGVSCTQQIDDLKVELGKRERWLRRNWPMLQHELQDANISLAVAQQKYEKAEEKACSDTIKANLRFSRLELKWKVTNEELRQAKKMLLADDTKALSSRILQECADEMANLMTQNHDKVVEILSLYRKRDIILKGHQDQVNACYAYIGELEVDKETFRTANLELKSSCISLYKRYQNLYQKNTDLQITNNSLQIANNDLQMNHYTLVRDNTALRADKESLGIRNAGLENDRSKLQKEAEALNMQKPSLQREISSTRSHGTRSQQGVPQPDCKRANLNTTKRSLQDLIDGAYPAQEEAFAAVRNQRRVWINRGPTNKLSNKNLPDASPKHETTPIPSSDHSSKKASTQNTSAHTATPAFLSPIESKVADTRSKQPMTSSCTANPQNTPIISRNETHTPQELNREAQQDSIKTSLEQDANKSVESASNRSADADTMSNEDIKPAKCHKTKKEKVEGATVGQEESVTTALNTQGGVMSRKERRAMKKQRCS